MDDKMIADLEKIMIPYVLERNDFNKRPFAGLAKALSGNLVQEEIEFFTWIAKAFVRCIVDPDIKIHLKDMATVLIAEAYVMMNYSPIRYSYIQRRDYSSTQTMIPLEILIPCEIHRWLIYLQELEKLPGTYDRFGGIYKGAYEKN